MADKLREAAQQALYAMAMLIDPEKLERENEALRADAERYRWLRSQWFTMGASYPDNTVQFHLGNVRWSEQPESNLDAAIDAAMKGQP